MLACRLVLPEPGPNPSDACSYPENVNRGALLPGLFLGIQICPCQVLDPIAPCYILSKWQPPPTPLSHTCTTFSLSTSVTGSPFEHIHNPTTLTTTPLTISSPGIQQILISCLPPLPALPSCPNTAAMVTLIKHKSHRDTLLLETMSKSQRFSHEQNGSM